MQEGQTLPHKLTVEERERLTMTGAREVLHFDDKMAQLDTARGEITVFGQGLKLKTLSLEGGTVLITGQIEAIQYGQSRKESRWSSFWK